MSWYFYDYIINIEDDIEKIMYWNGSEYVSEYLTRESIRWPYLLPLANDDRSLNISLPVGLSLLLFEMANQGIEVSISAKLDVSYQDIIGKEFFHSYIVTFMPTVETDNNYGADGYIYVSFQELGTTQWVSYMCSQLKILGADMHLYIAQTEKFLIKSWE